MRNERKTAYSDKFTWTSSALLYAVRELPCGQTIWGIFWAASAATKTTTRVPRVHVCMFNVVMLIHTFCYMSGRVCLSTVTLHHQTRGAESLSTVEATGFRSLIERIEYIDPCSFVGNIKLLRSSSRVYEVIAKMGRVRPSVRLLTRSKCTKPLNGFPWNLVLELTEKSCQININRRADPMKAWNNLKPCNRPWA